MSERTQTMGFTTRCKNILNRVVNLFGIHVEGLAGARKEKARLELLGKSGQFERAIFPVPESFRSDVARNNIKELLDNMQGFESVLEKGRATGEYSVDNEYFGSPDAEVLFSILNHYRPASIVEIGSGHSTHLIRLCIEAIGLDCRLIAADPNPRIAVERVVDVMHHKPVEQLSADEILDRLGENSVLFIDSSHTIKTGGDVVFLYLNVLPRLPVGVIVHIHDIFLPYEYPRRWVIDNGWGWNEQYLVQAFLTMNTSFEVLWPGHYLQRTEREFPRWFPRSEEKSASSLWLRKC